MIVQVLIRFLMLTLHLFIAPSTYNLFVQSVLWWANLHFFFFFLLIQFLTREVEISIHAVVKTLSLCQVGSSLLFSFLKTVITLHCVFNDKQHISLRLYTSCFGEFHVWQSCLESCEAGSLLVTETGCSEVPIRFLFMRMLKNIVLNNCDEGQPSSAILQYMYNYYNMHYSFTVHLR